MGLEMLEDEAMRRALHGDMQPVFYQGREVGSVRKRSDAMLMFLLRKHYRKRYHRSVDAAPEDGLKKLLAAVDGVTHDTAADKAVDGVFDGVFDGVVDDAADD